MNKSNYCIRLTNVASVKEFALYLSSQNYGTCVGLESIELKNTRRPLLLASVLVKNPEKKKKELSTSNDVLVLQIRTGDLVDKLSKELKINDTIAILKPKVTTSFSGINLHIGPYNAVVFIYSPQPNITVSGAFSFPSNEPVESFIEPDRRPQPDVIKPKAPPKLTKKNKEPNITNFFPSNEPVESFEPDRRAQPNVVKPKAPPKLSKKIIKQLQNKRPLSKKSCCSNDSPVRSEIHCRNSLHSCSSESLDEEDMRDFIKIYQVYKSVVKPNRSRSRSRKKSCCRSPSRSSCSRYRSRSPSCSNCNKSERSRSESRSHVNFKSSEYRSKRCRSRSISPSCQPSQIKLRRSRSPSCTNYNESERSGGSRSHVNKSINSSSKRYRSQSKSSIYQPKQIKQCKSRSRSISPSTSYYSQARSEFPEDHSAVYNPAADSQTLTSPSLLELNKTLNSNTYISSDGEDKESNKSENTIVMTEAMSEPTSSLSTQYLDS